MKGSPFARKQAIVWHHQPYEYFMKSFMNSCIKPSAKIITRFAPSPTGYLHLGHAYSAKYAHDFARERGGDFLLRMEDIDQNRCKKIYEEAIIEDLSWLGLRWDGPVRRQSEHFDDYRAALDQLDNMGLLYPCFCTRKEIQQEIAESNRAPHDLSQSGPEGQIYPGTCRKMSEEHRQDKIKQGLRYALRLDMKKALLNVPGPLYWQDIEQGEQRAKPEILGDVVLARKDIPTSYHLSVTVDDHLQKISHVIRGKDLFYASHLHRLLQFLLGYQTPTYLHHDLLLNSQGQRYAKRDQAKSLHYMRSQGADPENIFNAEN